MLFYRLDKAIDDELELVSPAARYVDDMLIACRHPEGLADPGSRWTRQQLVDFIAKYPDGIDVGDELQHRWPGYYFWMRLRNRPGYAPPVPFAGTLALRLSDSEQIRLYTGHVGYGVFPAARGNHYAERATRLILPLARAHGMDHLWITCNPDNLASRRTIERLGATYVETVDVPPDNIAYQRGDRQKCRYRIDLLRR
jgi:RimJ/RimL family protein N-acetyltransferase